MLLDKDFAQLSKRTERPAIWLEKMHKLLNLADVDSVNDPALYTQALVQYMDFLENHPTLFGLPVAWPFVRFFELLDKKGDALFFVGEAHEEHDQWLSNVEYAFLHLTDQPKRIDMLASAIAEKKWNPIPLLERCSKYGEILTSNSSMDFVFPLTTVINKAILEKGYTPLSDSSCLHTAWKGFNIGKTLVSTTERENLLNDVDRCIYLFPSSIGAAMRHFYYGAGCNDKNITSELKVRLANMDLSYARDAGLDALLNAITIWHQQDNEAWHIVSGKHPFFTQALGVHIALGYANRSQEDLALLRHVWLQGINNNTAIPDIALPDSFESNTSLYMGSQYHE